MNALAAHLQIYFTDFACTQRDLSPNTISAYRDTWRILLTYLANRRGVSVDRIDFPDITTDTVTAFLDYLETGRHNSVSTRNARLAGVRAVLTHALPHHLDHAGTITQVLALPLKRHPKTAIEYLTAEESDALINAPDRDRWTGRRDHAILVLDIQTGLRTSELRSLTLSDIHLDAGANVTCTGKGRKQRATWTDPVL